MVLVGERKDSQTYVNAKKKACAEAGIDSFGTDLPGDATEEEVLKVVADYNADPNVHGILVQLPMPDHIDEERVLGAISYEKDVDGFHPLNTGRLAQRGGPPLRPVHPARVHQLLERSGIEIAGKEAVVVAAPTSSASPPRCSLQRRDATVTIVHSRTPNSEEIVRRADIVIAACGRMEMVKGSWLKPGAAVIDVGINARMTPARSWGVQAGRRRGLQFVQGGGRRDHPRARRCRSHDHRHPPKEHHGGGHAGQRDDVDTFDFNFFHVF